MDTELRDRRGRPILNSDQERRRSLARAVVSGGILLNAIHFAPRVSGPLLGCLWIAAGLSALALLAQLRIQMRYEVDERGRVSMPLASLLLLAPPALIIAFVLCYDL